MEKYIRKVGYGICLGILTWVSLFTSAATLSGVIEVVVRGLDSPDDAGALLDRSHIVAITTVFTLVEVARFIFIPGPKRFLMGLIWSVSFRGTLCYFILLAAFGSVLFFGSFALQFCLIRDAPPIAAETQRIWAWLAVALMVPAVFLGILVTLPIDKAPVTKPAKT